MKVSFGSLGTELFHCGHFGQKYFGYRARFQWHNLRSKKSPDAAPLLLERALPLEMVLNLRKFYNCTSIWSLWSFWGWSIKINKLSNIAVEIFSLVKAGNVQMAARLVFFFQMMEVMGKIYQCWLHSLRFLCFSIARERRGSQRERQQRSQGEIGKTQTTEKRWKPGLFSFLKNDSNSTTSAALRCHAGVEMSPMCSKICRREISRRQHPLLVGLNNYRVLWATFRDTENWYRATFFPTGINKQIVKHEGKSCWWTSWKLVLDPLFSMENKDTSSQHAHYWLRPLSLKALLCHAPRKEQQDLNSLVHTDCKTNCSPVVGLSEGLMSGLRCRRSTTWRQGQRGASESKLEFKSGHGGFADVCFGLCSLTEC